MSSGGVSDVQRVLTEVKLDVEKDLSANEQFVDDDATYPNEQMAISSVATALELKSRGWLPTGTTDLARSCSMF